MSATISVVIPVYNGEGCLRSALSTARTLEVIFGDGSTDGRAERGQGVWHQGPSHRRETWSVQSTKSGERRKPAR